MRSVNVLHIGPQTAGEAWIDYFLEQHPGTAGAPRGSLRARRRAASTALRFVLTGLGIAVARRRFPRLFARASMERS